MKNVMLDLETMGTHVGAAVVAIGAVEFDGARLGREFYNAVSLASCLEAGLTVDGDTVSWWLEQSDAARGALLTHRVTLEAALNGFSKWLPKNTCVWGNGATFDNVLLTEAYRRAGINRPWHYRNDRDMRTYVFTAKGMGIDVSKLVTYEGDKHNALDDARNQARLVQAITKAIMEKTK